MLYSIGKDSLGDAAPRHEGVPPGQAAVPAAARRHDVEVPRDDTSSATAWPRSSASSCSCTSTRRACERGINPFDSRLAGPHRRDEDRGRSSRRSTQHGFDAAFGGARRDEEKSRAKERVFSFRSAQHRWDPKNQRPELWHLYNARKRRGESIRVFPLSNWTELDVWEYIQLEKIPVVPLYFAKERPIVRRDGTLLMVDDDRMPLEDGETPEMLRVRFRTLGCYPLTGAVESDAETLAGHRRGDARVADLRARGPRDRPRRRRLDGEEEAGGVLLTGVARAEPAALHHLRQRRRRQVDADRAPALRVGADPRGPDGGARGRLAALRHDRRRARLRAAARRALGRARAGHHDRRLAPLLLDRAAPLHRRRHAGPRAVHAQHGHRRLDRRLRGDPARRAQGRADPDAAALVARLAARHPPRRARGQQDGPRRLLRGALPRDRGGVRASSRARSGCRTCSCIPVSALAGDNVVEAQRAACPGTTARRCSATSRTSRSTSSAMEAAPFRMPVQLVSRPSSDFRGFAGTIAGGTVRPGDEIRVLPRDSRSTVERIVTYDGDLDEAVAGQSVTLTLADEIDASRGDMLAAAERPAGRRRPVRGDRRVDGRRPDVPRAQLPDADRLAARHRDDRAAEVQAQRQHARARRGDEARAQRDRRRRPRARPAGRVRPLRREPRDRRLHPHRPHLQRHRRRGHDPLRAAPRGEPAAGRRSTSTRRRARPPRASSRACSGSPASPARASRRSPTSSRPSCTAAAATPTCSTATTSATASTRTSASPQADRVENVRRVAEVARLMIDAGLIVLVSLHLAVPQRAADGARAVRRGRVPRGVRRHAARGRRGARPEGPLRQGARAASSRTSPASTRRTSRPSTPS